MAQKSGIYTITHIASGRQYVGQSSQIRDRWLFHKSSLRREKSANRFLQNAWTKHGELAFEFRLIEECESTDAALCAREQFWIDALKPVFNLAPVAGTTRGIKHPPRSDEFRRRQSEAKKGYKPTPETIALLKQRAAEIQYKHSPEIRAKISAQLKGKKMPAHHLEYLRSINTGRKQSAETIAKRVAKLKGHTVSEYTKQRTAESNRARLLGTKQSAELIEKRIAPLRGKKRPPEVIAIFHAALRERRNTKDELLRQIIAANLHLTITDLCPLIGRSFKPTSRLRKEVILQLAQQSDSASGEKKSSQKTELSSASPSTPPLQQNLPLG